MSIAFDIQVTGVFSRNLNGYFWAMGEMVKNRRMQVAPTYHFLQTEDFLCNPQNPLNPDSEANVRGKFYR